MVRTTWGSNVESSNNGLFDLWAFMTPKGWTSTEQTTSRAAPESKIEPRRSFKAKFQV
jgi:hypothetical protein